MNIEMDPTPMEQLNARKLREQEEEWAREQEWVEESQRQTLGEILGVKHLWRKVGTLALIAGLAYGGDQYINYKVEQVTDNITEQIDEQVTKTGEELGNQVSDSIEAKLKEDLLNYLLESNNG